VKPAARSIIARHLEFQPPTIQNAISILRTDRQNRSTFRRWFLDRLSRFRLVDHGRDDPHQDGLYQAGDDPIPDDRVRDRVDYELLERRDKEREQGDVDAEANAFHDAFSLTALGEDEGEEEGENGHGQKPHPGVGVHLRFRADGALDLGPHIGAAENEAVDDECRGRIGQIDQDSGRPEFLPVHKTLL